MGKASSSKKVARAASTGGGRTARGRTPWGWYSSIFLVVVVGTLLIVVSRGNVNKAAAEPPTVKDHWHTAYSIDICGSVKANLPQPSTLIGIHTHTDGLIHVEPQNSLDTGKHATLGRFVSGEPGFKLTRTTIQYPGEKLWHNGDKCPDGKAGKVVAKVWDDPNSSKGTIVSGDPNKILIKNDRLLAIGFVTDGGSSLKQPASKATLPDAANIPENTSTSAVPGATPPSTAPGATPTTAAGTPPTTAAPASPSTSPPTSLR
jgi:hypothetical protein